MGNTKFSAYNCVCGGEYVAISHVVMRGLCRIIADIVNLDEWQFSFEDQRVGDASPRLVLNFTTDDGENHSCAPAKMRTLRNHSGVANTGELLEIQLCVGEVNYYGGINIPYVLYEGFAKNSTPVEGIIRLVFSGANQAVDLAIVIEMLKEYADACEDFLPESSYVFDYQCLEKDQLSDFLMQRIFAI